MTKIDSDIPMQTQKAEIKVMVDNITKEALTAIENGKTRKAFFEEKKELNTTDNQPEEKRRKAQLLCDIAAGVDELENISTSINEMVKTDLSVLFGVQQPEEKLNPLFEFRKDNNAEIEKAYKLQIKSRFVSSLCQIPILPLKIQNYIQTGNEDDILNSIKIIQKLTNLFNNRQELNNLFPDIRAKLNEIFPIADIPLYAYNFKFNFDSSNELTQDDNQQLIKSVRTMIFLINLSTFTRNSEDPVDTRLDHFDIFCSIWIRKISEHLQNQTSRSTVGPVSTYIHIYNVAKNLAQTVQKESEYLPKDLPQLDMAPFMQSVKDLFYCINENTITGFFVNIKLANDNYDPKKFGDDPFGFYELLLKASVYFPTKEYFLNLLTNVSQPPPFPQKCDTIQDKKEYWTRLVYCIIYPIFESHSETPSNMLSILLYAINEYLPHFIGNSFTGESMNEFIKMPILLNSLYSSYAPEIINLCNMRNANEPLKLSELILENPTFSQFAQRDNPPGFEYPLEVIVKNICETTISWIIMNFTAPNSQLTPMISKDTRLKMRAFVIQQAQDYKSETRISQMSQWYCDQSQSNSLPYWDVHT